MYHVHTAWTNKTSNSAAGGALCAQAAGHYDPNLACGYTSTKCTILGRQSAATYNCTPAVYNAGQYSQCQVGDLSGKFGKTYGINNVFTQPASIPYDVQPSYPANFLAANAISTAWSSVVFHCSDNTRLVCAKFQLVASGSPSVCSFPAVLDPIVLFDEANYQLAVINKETNGQIVLTSLFFPGLAVVLVALLVCYIQRRRAKLEVNEKVISPVVTDEVAQKSVPSVTPAAAPTAAPTSAPTSELSVTPTAAPTATPTAAPIAAPTAVPSVTPTAVATSVATSEPPADDPVLTEEVADSGVTSSGQTGP